MAYTREDFDRLLQESGLSGQFSQYDINLGQSNPDAGVSLISAKRGYGEAKTPEDKARYNQQANDIRNSYGNYTGGANGLEYNLQGVKNNSTQAPRPTFSTTATPPAAASAPTYTPSVQAPAETAAPAAYVSPYSGQIDSLIAQITGRSDFSYDPQTDPSYQSYKKEYTREGDRAYRDALATNAAMTGGLPSTYAQTAAQQQQDYYNSQMADKIPELKQLAYDMWLNNLNQQRSDVSMLQGQDDMLYGRHRDDVSDYQTDRAYNRSVYESDRDFDFGTYQQNVSNYYNDLNFNRGVYESDRDFDWNQYLQNNANWDTDRNFEKDSDESKWAQAFDTWNTLGYLDDNSAAILGLPSGTKTADYDVTMQQLALQKLAAARSGSGTKKNTEDKYTAAQLTSAAALKEELKKKSLDGSLAASYMNAYKSRLLPELGEDLFKRMYDSYSGNAYDSLLDFSEEPEPEPVSYEYEPMLTASQVRTEVNKGNTSPQVLRDYEYWFGAAYSEPVEAEEPDDTSLSANGKAISSRLASLESNGSDSAALESIIQNAYDAGGITAYDLRLLASMYGIDIDIYG